MEKALTIPKVTGEDADAYKSAIDQMFRQMEESRKRIERLQRDSERLKEKTRKTLARLKAE